MFEMAGLRRILGVTRRDRLPNDDIEKHLHLQKEVSYRIQQRLLRRFSHAVRMNDGRHLKIALFGGVLGIR